MTALTTGKKIRKRAAKPTASPLLVIERDTHSVNKVKSTIVRDTMLIESSHI